MAIKLTKGNAPKTPVTPVVTDAQLQKIAILREIRDLHLATVEDGEGNKVPVTAADDYVWNYYRQVKDAHPELSGQALIAQVVDEISPEGDDASGIIPTVAEMRYAPSWTSVVAGQINKSEDFAVAFGALAHAKELVSKGPVPMAFHLRHIDWDFCAIPGSQMAGEKGSYDTTTQLCDPGKTWKIGKDGKVMVNQGNAGVKLDVFRVPIEGGKTVPYSAYMFLALQTTSGKIINKELEDYEQGCRDVKFGGPFGVHTTGEGGAEKLTSYECKKEMNLRKMRLRELASKLRDIWKLHHQMKGINGMSTSDGKRAAVAEFITTTATLDGKTVEVLDKHGGTKPLRISEYGKPTNFEDVGYSTMNSFNLETAKNNGGHYQAIRDSGVKVKPPQTPGSSQTGGGHKTDEVQIVNVNTEQAVQYMRGLVNWFTKDKGVTPRREGGKPANQDMLQLSNELRMELTDFCRVYASNIDKIDGLEAGTTLADIEGKLKAA